MLNLRVQCRGEDTDAHRDVPEGPVPLAETLLQEVSRQVDNEVSLERALLNMEKLSCAAVRDSPLPNCLSLLRFCCSSRHWRLPCSGLANPPIACAPARARH